MKEYFIDGKWTLIKSAPAALVLWLAVVAAEWTFRYIRKKPFRSTVHYAALYFWFLMILTILKITGIIGGTFELSSLPNGNISVIPFEDGFSIATILNIILFIPYGFFAFFAFQNLQKHWRSSILFGATFSTAIEITQLFIGRYAQLDDIIMNTCGTIIGYFSASFLQKIWSRIRS